MRAHQRRPDDQLLRRSLARKDVQAAAGSGGSGVAEWPAPPLRCVRIAELGALGHGDSERGGDIADSRQACGAVTGGLVALDLLLGDAQCVSQSAL